MKTKPSRTSAVFSLCLLGMIVVFSGCAGEGTQNPARLESNSTQQNTSAIPWNRPQSWEGSTGYGGMVNQPGSGH
ncbi:MAG: hypothetical protein ABIP97_04310 [Chthoniobacterales bacterium]